MKEKSFYSVYFHAVVSTILSIALAGCASVMHEDGKFTPGASAPDEYIQGNDKYDNRSSKQSKDKIYQ